MATCIIDLCVINNKHTDGKEAMSTSAWVS